MWFSHRMDRHATSAALRVTDTVTGGAVAGKATWNDQSTQVTFTPDQPLAAGHAFEVSLGKGGRDADGNTVKAKWTFSTKAPVVVSAPGARPASRCARSRSRPRRPRRPSPAMR